MKKVGVTLIFILISSFYSFSQSGNFVIFSGLLGPSSNWNGGENNDDIIGLGLDLKFGYRFSNNLQLSTGIKYLKTGYSNKMSYVQPLNNADPDYYEEYKFTHLLVPVELGYAFKLGQRFCLIPSVNIGLSHLMGGNYFAQTENFYKEKFDAARLKSNYYSYTFWAGAGIHLSYNITERIGLITGYQFNSMISDFSKISSSDIGNEMMFIISGDVGFKYSF